MHDDDPFRRHLDDYAAVGEEGAVPPMVHEIYRRGRRHQRLQTMTWSVVGVLTLVATFLAGMVVRDQTNPTIAGAALPTTTTPPTSSSSLLDLFPTTSTFASTTLFPPTTTYPFSTGTSATTSSFTSLFTTTPTTRTTSTTPTTAAPSAPKLTSGKHSVILKEIEGSRVTFDKVEFFRGDAAIQEARKDGRSTTNGWYIRNENPALRTHTATANVLVQARNGTMDKTGPSNQLTIVTLGQLAAKIPTSTTTLFLITLSSGQITAITEHDLS